ncbi:MAG: hypothetical protein ACRYHQ_09075 [Janthinobacterium lividum]
MEQLPSISLSPPENAVARRTGRVVAMVHELHKAGYQLLRISPGLSPSGFHWRCPITCAANVEADGFSVKDVSRATGLFLPYTSADTGYFGWAGAEILSARELAARFLRECPVLAQAGYGRDLPYAGWLTEVLGVVERGEMGRYPVLYADFPLDPAAQPIPLPPPPQ